jgi:hypothetical protein
MNTNKIISELRKVENDVETAISAAEHGNIPGALQAVAAIDSQMTSIRSALDGLAIQPMPHSARLIELIEEAGY